MAKTDILASFETGDVPTGEDFAALIEAAHEATTVSEVSTWTSPLGTSVSWLSCGKLYSFWSHGVLNDTFTLLEGWRQWATPEDVPPLAAYVGEPMHELLWVETDAGMESPVGILEISNLGFRIRSSVGEIAILEGWRFIANKMLILDVQPGAAEPEPEPEEPIE